jgi:outer membrane immunogenic protein
MKNMSLEFCLPNKASLMKTTAAASVAFLALTMTARAADLPVEPQVEVYEPVDVQPTAYDWSGAYLGAMLGYTWAEYNPEALSDIDDNGYVAGGYAGFNLQSGSLVFGLEGDFAAVDLDDTSGGTSLETDMVGSVRGRVGYAFDRVLAYGTGGVAFANVTADDGTVSDDNWHSGYVVGAGLEAAMTDHVLARVEYLYSDFGEETYNLTANTDADLTSHTIRAGLGYKF